eukprot:scaffold12447_cov111-Isochrysis_galbana.AAC.3
MPTLCHIHARWQDTAQSQAQARYLDRLLTRIVIGMHTGTCGVEGGSKAKSECAAPLRVYPQRERVLLYDYDHQSSTLNPPADPWPVAHH